MMQRLVPLLRTNQLDETIAFYVDILGFTCAEKNEDWGWAAIHLDYVDIMLAVPNEHVPFEKPQFTGSFYIPVSNVDKLWARLKDKVEVVYPIEDLEWQMREFAIRDNDGYMLQFGQEML